MLKKLISIFIVLLLLPLPARALDTKTCGKLGMVAVLGTAAIIVKVLINKEHKAVVNLHESLGPPDRSLEFQQGFDHWKIEWYGKNFYIFRNGFVYNNPICTAGRLPVNIP